MNVPPPKTFSDLVGFSLPQIKGPMEETHGTTVLALRYDQGILVLADRRATMGNLIMYDQADKIFELDDRTVVAISGSFARSIEICRMLRHSFNYYRRMHLNDMSLDGKLQEVSRALSDNLPMVMQGIGVFVPILAAYDPRTESFDVYFFDTAGARFQNAAYATAGSGSERIRGIFEYLGRTKKPWAERPLDEVLGEALHMLDIAADLDSATGGFTKHLPMAHVLDKNGTHAIPEAQLQKAVSKVLAGSSMR